MNALYIIPEYYENLPYAFPIGPAYILSSLKKKNVSVQCLNLNFEKTPLNNLLKNIYQFFKFGVVITGGLSTDYNKVKKIVKSVRDFKREVIIIVGGGLVTSMPEQILLNLKPDFVSIGEGEINIYEILKNLENGENDFEKIKGIGYLRDGRPFITQPEYIKDIDVLPFPDYELVDINSFLENQKKVFKGTKLMPIVSSRGCPFNCTFCFHTSGAKYRSRSLENFFKEMELLIEKYNINNFIIYDELLSGNRERLSNFCENISKYNVKWACQLRVDIVTEDILKQMKDSGCYLINYGIESISDKILKSMRKKINKNQIENALSLTRKTQIGIQGNLIFGDKEETFETAMETLNWWKENNFYCLTLCYIIPYPGTEAFKYCIKNGIIEDEIAYIENECPMVNMSSMSNEEYEKFRKTLGYMFEKYKYKGQVLKKEENKVTLKCTNCNHTDKYIVVDFIGKVMCKNCKQWYWID